MPPGYCREREVSLLPENRDGSQGLRQTQAPLLGLPGEAGALGEEGDQIGAGSGERMDYHK